MAFPHDPSGNPLSGDAQRPNERPAGNRPAQGARITGFGSADDPTRGASGGSEGSWLFGEGEPKAPLSPGAPHVQPQVQPAPSPFEPQPGPSRAAHATYGPDGGFSPSSEHATSAHVQPGAEVFEPVVEGTDTWLMEHDGELPADPIPVGAAPAGFQGSYAEPEDPTSQAARWAPRLMALVFLGALGTGAYRFLERSSGLLPGNGPVDDAGLAPERDLHSGFELVGADRGTTPPTANQRPVREIQSVRSAYDGPTREPGELSVLSGPREPRSNASVAPGETNERPGLAAQPGPEAPGSVQADALANESVTEPAPRNDGPARTDAFVREERRRQALATLAVLDGLLDQDPAEEVPSQVLPGRSLSPVVAGPSWIFVPQALEVAVGDLGNAAESGPALGLGSLALGAAPVAVDLPPVAVLPAFPQPSNVASEEALRASVAFVGETPRVEVVTVERSEPDPAPLPVVAEPYPGRPIWVAGAPFLLDEALAFAPDEPLPAPLDVQVAVADPVPVASATSATPAAQATPEAPVGDRVVLQVVPAPDQDFPLGEGPDAWLERRSEDVHGESVAEAPAPGASPAVAALLERMQSERTSTAGAEDAPAPEDEVPVAPTPVADGQRVAAVDPVEPEASVPGDPADGAGPATPVAVAEDPSPLDAVEAEVLAPAQPVAQAQPVTEESISNDESLDGDALLRRYSEWMLLQDMAPPHDPGGSLPFEVARGQRASAHLEDPQAVAAAAGPEEPQSLGVLRRLTDDESWQGTDPPLHVLRGTRKVATPNVGAVRVVQLDGEVFEGRLLAVGQGKVWVDSKVGTLALPGDRVRHVARLDPTQLDASGKGTEAPDYRALPHVRVRTPGGVFVGRQLDRVGDRVTLMTDDGFKITLVSDDVSDADAATQSTLRRIDGAR